MSISKSTAQKFLQALSEECQRTMRLLKAPGYPRPYYISYLLRDLHTTQLWGRLGNINNVNDADQRNLYCDCRVGSYRYDQVTEGGLDDNDTESDTYEHVEMPIGNDTDALKYHVWKLTEARYREAVQQYLRKKAQHIAYVDANANLNSFTRLKPIRDVRPQSLPPINVDDWIRFINKSSLIAKKHPKIKSSWVEMRVKDIVRVFVNSDGSELLETHRICELSCELWLLTSSGEGIRTHVTHVTPNLEDLPSCSHFIKEIRRRIELLDELSRAATIKSYAGPVLLTPGPAGILFHEVLGHRLEGSRLLSSQEGQTFKRDLGKSIIPSMFTIVDDPTIEQSCGVNTVGTYRYDDEGTPAKSVTLVKSGKLVGFLSGRTPVLLEQPDSNGHARNEYHERPISRMANLIVTVDNPKTDEELKRLLLSEIRRQKLPFGIIVLDAEGGETATDAYDFQAFMGNISLARQLWADGTENWIRNVSFVGTPLSAVRTVIAAGNHCICENAFCGAESGMIPVSTTCPAVLLANLELQASDQKHYTQYLLPMPFEKAALEASSVVKQKHKRPSPKRV